MYNISAKTQTMYELGFSCGLQILPKSLLSRQTRCRGKGLKEMHYSNWIPAVGYLTPSRNICCLFGQIFVGFEESCICVIENTMQSFVQAVGKTMCVESRLGRTKQMKR